MDTVNFKCSKCGLSNEDRGDYTCKINGAEIDIFPDEGEIVKVDDEWVHRHLTWCTELDFKEDIVVDSDPDYSIDWLHDAVDTYVNQIGLDGHLVEWAVLKIGGKFQDCMAFDGFYIGRSFSKCVEELDKAAAGQQYGTPLENWEKD